MATTPHSTVADPDIHEPKGVSTAGANTTYVADGAGSGAWTASAQYSAQGYMHTSTNTVIGAGSGDSGNPIKITGTPNWVSSHADGFTIATNGRFTYTGAKTTEFLVEVQCEGTVAASTQTMRFYVAKNGTIVTASRARQVFASTAEGHINCFAIVSLATNDYIEVFIENETATQDWVSSGLNMAIVSS